MAIPFFDIVEYVAGARGFAASREDELPEIALELGRSVDVLKARRQLLERQVAREFGNV